MTGIAGDPSGVIRRDHLRKALRFGSIGLMATGTYDGCIQLRRLHRAGIVRVLRQGPVASLASDNHMLAKLFLIHDVGMAGLAGIMPGKRNRPRRNFADRRPSIVAILPKTTWYNSRPQDHESHQRDCDDHRQTNQVFDILKQVRVPCAVLPGAICAQNYAMLF